MADDNAVRVRWAMDREQRGLDRDETASGNGLTQEDVNCVKATRWSTDGIGWEAHMVSEEEQWDDGCTSISVSQSQLQRNYLCARVDTAARTRRTTATCRWDGGWYGRQVR